MMSSLGYPETFGFPISSNTGLVNNFPNIHKEEEFKSLLLLQKCIVTATRVLRANKIILDTFGYFQPTSFYCGVIRILAGAFIAGASHYLTGSIPRPGTEHDGVTTTLKYDPYECRIFGIEQIARGVFEMTPHCWGVNILADSFYTLKSFGVFSSVMWITQFNYSSFFSSFFNSEAGEIKAQVQNQ